MDRKTHAWRIEDREYARQESRRGRRHAFTTVVPDRTALVVIDMVPFFVAENEYTFGIVPNIARLAGIVRAAPVPASQRAVASPTPRSPPVTM